MRITFLGTGTSQGVPIIACKCEVCRSDDPRDKRLRASVLIEVDGIVMVVDTGPDFRQQMLRAAVDHLDAILLTHGHKDHLAGLDDVRAFNYIQRRPMDVYAREDVHQVVRNEFSYAFGKDRYPGVPEIRLHEIHHDSFDVSGVSIIPVEVMHYHLPVLGFRIHDFVYITDASYIPPAEKEKLYGAEVLVINALRKQQHYSHFNLAQALDLIEEVEPRKAYLTHLSHIMGLHAVVEKELPRGVHLGYDGLCLNGL